MSNIERKDIYIISRHSDQSEKMISKILTENIYSDRTQWQKFIRLFFLSLGIGFMVAGLIFFFAYNWAHLHKYIKLGIAEALVIGTTILVLLPSMNRITKNSLLTGATLLVGVLFAVFGQVYQTGANAYDLFFAWTAFVTLWVLVSNFAPLWIVYLILINTTIILYAEQVAQAWSGIFICTILFGVHAAVLIGTILTTASTKMKYIPQWFSNLVAITAATFATIGIINGIFESYEPSTVVLLIVIVITYAMGIWYGIHTKSAFYIALILFSMIVIMSSVLVKISDGAAMLLMVSFFIIASVTLVIRTLMAYQKKWTNEK